jgi:hypothetical protein
MERVLSCFAAPRQIAAARSCGWRYMVAGVQLGKILRQSRRESRFQERCDFFVSDWDRIENGRDLGNWFRVGLQRLNYLLYGALRTEYWGIVDDFP